jgi:hypothetical protein
MCSYTYGKGAAALLAAGVGAVLQRCPNENQPRLVA